LKLPTGGKDRFELTEEDAPIAVETEVVAEVEQLVLDTNELIVLPSSSRIST
jgi:hypothetical protein